MGGGGGAKGFQPLKRGGGGKKFNPVLRGGGQRCAKGFGPAIFPFSSPPSLPVINDLSLSDRVGRGA